MQHELDLRLIKDNKIVGHAYIRGQDVLRYNNNEYDSFELLSPFRDKNNQRLWEGDIIQNTSSKQKTIIKYGKWKSCAGAGCGFYGILLIDVDSIPISFHPDQKYIEKIGTIHDDLKGVNVE